MIDRETGVLSFDDVTIGPESILADVWSATYVADICCGRVTTGGNQFLLGLGHEPQSDRVKVCTLKLKRAGDATSWDNFSQEHETETHWLHVTFVKEQLGQPSAVELDGFGHDWKFSWGNVHTEWDHRNFSSEIVIEFGEKPSVIEFGPKQPQEQQRPPVAWHEGARTDGPGPKQGDVVWHKGQKCTVQYVNTNGLLDLRNERGGVHYGVGKVQLGPAPKKCVIA